uniref:Uncharacterized protein n=1 Tax=Heterorhabditis bacteriophora TaxID=37862 RepID=A0A1I7X3Z6_HETBA
MATVTCRYRVASVINDASLINGLSPGHPEGNHFKDDQNNIIV